MKDLFLFVWFVFHGFLLHHLIILVNHFFAQYVVDFSSFSY